MSSQAQIQADLVARVNQAFLQARHRFHMETNNVEAAWEFGRACFDRAALLKHPNEIEKIAREGIAACRLAITNNPACAPAHYYLGMTIGQLADTKRNLAALRMVKEIEREFKRALHLDEKWDYAGPDRNLGLLYSQAPIIISVGSRSKARQHLRRAVLLAPDYPENRLNLLEAFWKWGDRDSVRRELKALEELWPAARKEFTGDAWVGSWADWEQRLKRAKEEMGRTLEPLHSPHQAD